MINFGYTVCFRDDRKKFRGCLSYTFIETAMKEFRVRIEVGYEFVTITTTDDNRLIASHSKEAFDTFKNTIEAELRK